VAPASTTGQLGDLAEREALAWNEIVSLVEPLTLEEAALPGYYPDAGWSIKDLLAHIGSWLAEAGVMLYRIMGGTYRPDDVDIEALNRTFLETMRDVEYEIIRAQCWASRARMLHVLSRMEQRGPDALWWFEKAGPDHYQEHIPRLHEWVKELRAPTCP
jgi:mycothiol maleylpyruvate isomerase-like protein